MKLVHHIVRLPSEVVLMMFSAVVLVFLLIILRVERPK